MLRQRRFHRLLVVALILNAAVIIMAHEYLAAGRLHNGVLFTNKIIMELLRGLRILFVVGY